MSFPWDDQVFIVAEAGVNHNGDVKLAKKLIDAAVAAKADAVKFQTWKPGELTGKFALKTSYMEDTTPENESRTELSKRLCLPYQAFRELQIHCNEKGILFLSTPDGFESLDFLAGELDIPYIKIGSTELNHLQFLRAVGRKGKPAILSTGLGTMEEVGEAIAALREGGGADLPIVVLQCTSQYPAPDEDVNIRAMTYFRQKFNLPAGLSDHSTGIEAAIAAVALGARIVEKHYTLDKTMEGPDHQASLDPVELAALVQAIRRTEVMLGDGQKRLMASEAPNLPSIRRSVVAAQDIGANTVLTAEMLTCKRPATGVVPKDMDNLIGKKLVVDVKEDQPIEEPMVG